MPDAGPFESRMARVIGLSGLPNSLDFRAAHVPGGDRNLSRIAQGLDAAAALVDSGQVIAAVAEERLSRVKGTCAFPIEAIRFCLQAGGLEPADVDVVAHGFAYGPHQARYEHSAHQQLLFDEVLSPGAFQRSLGLHCPEYDWARKVEHVPHHLAHAASAFYPSGFSESLILVSDGMGEQHSAMIATGSPAGIEVLAQVPALHSVGILYSVFTVYLGFAFNSDEYKVMGLAPYGNSRRYFSQIMSLVKLKDDGCYTIPVLFANSSREEQETYAGTLREISVLLGPARERGGRIEQRHCDLAASLQAVLQACLLHTLRHFRQQTGLDRLCMAGGVALNCTANGVIKRSRLFKQMFVQPASGDDGAALGAALWVARRQNPASGPARMGLPLLGPAFSDAEIEQALVRHGGLHWTRFDCQDALLTEVAARLDQGAILGWFQGRSEFGPRALGNRSILADPRCPQMRDEINARIKKREDFRPFAPAVVAERAADYFMVRAEDRCSYDSMLFVEQVRPEMRERLPAVTHVNGSARVQTVCEADNPRFWQLLNAFEQYSGMPILLNTSFNVKGQPIVNQPSEAIETFFTANLDGLVLGDILLTRPEARDE